MLPDTIHVEVTQEDIDEGKPDEPCACPIALALKRWLDTQADINGDFAVGLFRVADGVHLTRIDGVEYEMPNEAGKFIDLFDAKVSPTSESDLVYKRTFFEPFEFDMVRVAHEETHELEEKQ